MKHGLTHQARLTRGGCQPAGALTNRDARKTGRRRKEEAKEATPDDETAARARTTKKQPCLAFVAGSSKLFEDKQPISFSPA